jgi:predicted small lipoprotein YifL
MKQNMVNVIKGLLVALTVSGLVGCGSFPLGTVYPIQGQTAPQRDADMLVCKDRAKNEANTDARVAGSFLAGLTIIGAPIAIEAEKAKQREVFAQCLTERGYRVEPPKL